MKKSKSIMQLESIRQAEVLQQHVLKLELEIVERLINEGRLAVYDEKVGKSWNVFDDTEPDDGVFLNGDQITICLNTELPPCFEFINKPKHKKNVSDPELKKLIRETKDKTDKEFTKQIEDEINKEYTIGGEEIITVTEEMAENNPLFRKNPQGSGIIYKIEELEKNQLLTVNDMNEAKFRKTMEEFRQEIETMCRKPYVDGELTYMKPEELHIDLEYGSKNVRIVKREQREGEERPNHRSAFGFVEISSGNILKANGWKSPHPTPRGNIYSPDRMKSVTEHGIVHLR